MFYPGWIEGVDQDIHKTRTERDVAWPVNHYMGTRGSERINKKTAKVLKLDIQDKIVKF